LIGYVKNHYGPQNWITRRPDVNNPITKLLSDIRFPIILPEHSDGSRPNLQVGFDTPTVVANEVLRGKVRKVVFRVAKYNNEFYGIEMKDKKGKRLFSSGTNGEVEYVFTLDDDEVIVGFRSHTPGEGAGAFACHYDFQLMVMCDIKANDLQACECWHELFERVKPEDTDLKGLQMNLFKDILAFDGVRVEKYEHV
jgi:hypothetical protein